MIEHRFIRLQLESPRLQSRIRSNLRPNQDVEQGLLQTSESQTAESDEVGLRKREPGYKRHHLLPVHVWDLSGRHAVVQYRVWSIQTLNVVNKLQYEP